jgi:fructose-1,6-bisphosphatase-3
MINDERLNYLSLLSKDFPSIPAAATEIINLSAVLDLPKGTEHFLSDVHGEDEAFLHVLKNGSGSIRRKVDMIFKNTLLEKDKSTISTLIYYPQEKLKELAAKFELDEEWYRVTLFRLVKLLRVVASKYTRSRVRKALPKDFCYIIEELLHENEELENKSVYYRSIIDTILSTHQEEAFIIAIAQTIKDLNIDKLHIIGDIYDRGPGAHIIMDTLVNYNGVDVQWGNHDIVWMGAAAGCEACMANVIRTSLRYCNMQTLENGYGISLLPLASLAMDVYGDDLSEAFILKESSEQEHTEYERQLLTRMHKAISIIQQKLDGQIIMRRPEFEMGHRLLLDKLDLTAGTVEVEGKNYKLNDTFFPSIDKANPYQLCDKEQAVVDQLKVSFMLSEKLQKHVRFLYARGSMYRSYNGNLLFHGCIPLNKKGEFEDFTIAGKTCKGKAFMDHVALIARQGYFSKDAEDKLYGLDTIWYLWSGANSPIFGKDKMATFERYFIDDEATHKEEKNCYYRFRDDEATCRKILEEFGINPETGIIINGHVPVKVRKGESPLKANGKLLVIDGGFSKAYHKQTGIAGYTLVYNSHGMMLCAHEAFDSKVTAIKEELDIHSSTKVIVQAPERIRVRDTDRGKRIEKQNEDLSELIEAFRKGYIMEG